MKDKITIDIQTKASDIVWGTYTKGAINAAFFLRTYCSQKTDCNLGKMTDDKLQFLVNSYLNYTRNIL